MRETAPILRHWKILRSLSVRGQGATLREMSDDTGVSQKTISRDLSMLRQLGFPLVESVGEINRKRWRLEHAKGVPPVSFTLEEAAAIYLGRQFLEPLAGTFFHKGSRSAFEKLRTSFGDAALRHIELLARTFYHKTHGFSDYTSKAEVIDQLQMAIEDHRVTSITYHPLRSTEPITYHKLHPYGIVVHKHALYLLAWSDTKRGYRTFKIHRVSGVDVQRATFSPKKSFDLEATYQNSFGIFHATTNPCKVKVRFHPDVQRILEEREFHESQQLSLDDSGFTIATFHLGALEEFQSWVLSFGHMAEVLEPIALRHSIHETLKRSIANYQQPAGRSPTVLIDNTSLPKQKHRRLPLVARPK